MVTPKALSNNSLNVKMFERNLHPLGFALLRRRAEKEISICADQLDDLLTYGFQENLCIGFRDPRHPATKLWESFQGSDNTIHKLLTKKHPDQPLKSPRSV